MVSARLILDLNPIAGAPADDLLKLDVNREAFSIANLVVIHQPVIPNVVGL